VGHPDDGQVVGELNSLDDRGSTDAVKQARLEREAAALRENLQRRKQQARARRTADGGPGLTPPEPKAGSSSDKGELPSDS
jgi:hypothetical protein